MATASGPTIWFWMEGGGGAPTTSFVWRQAFPLITWLARLPLILL